MEDQKQQFIQRLKEAKNVMVTVSKNPTVDQLSAAIGLAVALNHLDKHATAVFSGEIPSTMQFLRPEETLEKTTDSLRDFIIALDKSKADKLRYKVEDDVVRIFITPYHTAISQSDLDFSQGEFNIDVVVALGVHEQQDLDDAVQAHGRILHDALFATLSLDEGNGIGVINIVDPSASSLSEMVLDIVENLGKKVLDVQIATALLTGIVAMTDRFSNDRTSPKTMSASAALMAAGANQQLITTELEAAEPEPEPQDPVLAYDKMAGISSSPEDEPSGEKQQTDLGTLEINHGSAVPSHIYDPDENLPEVDSDNTQIHVDENGRLSVLGMENDEDETSDTEAISLPKLNDMELPKIELKKDRMAEPPVYENQTAADLADEGFGIPTEQLSEPQSVTPILSHNMHVLEHDSTGVADEAQGNQTYKSSVKEQTFVPSIFKNPSSKSDDSSHDRANKTLSEIEAEVNSPHLHANDNVDLEAMPNDTPNMASTKFVPGDQSNQQQTPPYRPMHSEDFSESPFTPPQPPMSLPQPTSSSNSFNSQQSNSSQPTPPPVPPPMMSFN